MKEKIMIIGAAGQIGSELTVALREIYGSRRVFATDIKQASPEVMDGGPFQILDVMNDKMLIHFVIQNKITQIYHLAAVLSGNAEKFPTQAWRINMESLMNILEVARMVETVHRVFWPSSIAVFGPTTPHKNTPQLTVMEPTTVYGISKLAGERWCAYFNKKHDLDIRSIRYPGLISYKTEAGGGTTDYAVEVYFKANKNKRYECFISENTKMPFLFMPDAIDATIKLMQADRKYISIHSGYNIGGLTLAPIDFYHEIKRVIPEFEMTYKPDFREDIARTWPESIDGSTATKDWGFEVKYDLTAMTDIMFEEIRKKYGE
ncbi:MAG: NAD-dependent epimerase/dehydratase family protein [Bacteroidia bacterium]|nr:NAD-dependent epimerase/dehydratase family protein [Bacteroidia bacterium]